MYISLEFQWDIYDLSWQKQRNSMSPASYCGCECLWLCALQHAQVWFKGCVSLDPSKISKSGWWGLQLDTWQLCNSLIRRCHTSNVLNHPADLSGMDLTSDPSWFTHSPGKASTKRYSPQIFKGSLLFSWNKYCVSSVLIPNDCQCSSKQLLYPPYPKDRGMLWFYVEAARRPQWC